MIFKPGDSVAFRNKEVLPHTNSLYSFGMVADDNTASHVGISYFELKDGTPVLCYAKVERALVAPASAAYVYEVVVTQPY